MTLQLYGLSCGPTRPKPLTPPPDVETYQQLLNWVNGDRSIQHGRQIFWEDHIYTVFTQIKGLHKCPVSLQEIKDNWHEEKDDDDDVQ